MRGPRGGSPCTVSVSKLVQRKLTNVLTFAYTGGPVVLEIFPALSLVATGKGLRRTPLPSGVLVPTGSGPPCLAAQHLLRLFVACITSESELCCLLYLGPASAMLYSLHDDDGCPADGVPRNGGELVS
ncbi:hypothetical protein NUW54_g8828 [Trametes sanguinea]|uniref:Uncharacterized protein n=1 Tax=Trametes sanguinea TaxID=158606 RepID=A0ACC1PDL3_9APHY|nr:hypothetical protein NUW54_g8828 [Trametes sanguinea]